MQNNTDQTTKRLQDIIIKLEQRIAYLERENARRKNEITALSNALRQR